MNATITYQVVVSVGTDHHLFDRLIDWMDNWAQKQDALPLCFIQHGSSRPAEFGTNRDRLPREELLEIYRNAQVVIVQGGPGSILDAREVGAIPLAIPRIPELKEVVDGHQIEFTRVMAAHGNAIFIDNEDDLHHMIDAVLTNPDDYRTEPRIASPDVAGRALADELDKVGKGSVRGLSTLLRRTKQVVTRK